MRKWTAKKTLLAALQVAGLVAFLGNTSALSAETIRTLTYPDGSQYVGEVVGNVPNGQGATTWPDGKRFTGEYRNGKSNGHGTIILPDGRRYVGEFRDNKPEGQGTSYWPNGQIRFSGMWHDGQFTGRTIASTTLSRSPEPSSTDPTRAQTTPNTATNQGTLKLSKGQAYIGQLRDGKPNGFGTMTFPDGQKYIGQFVDGLRNGQATVTFADGRKFTGEYRDDKRNGPGTLVLPNGEKYVGEYRDGEKNGQGTSYLANGEIQSSGSWANGNFVGGSSPSLQANNERTQNAPSSAPEPQSVQRDLPPSTGVFEMNMSSACGYVLKKVAGSGDEKELAVKVLAELYTGLESTIELLQQKPRLSLVVGGTGPALAQMLAGTDNECNSHREYTITTAATLGYFHARIMAGLQ
jgi:hypothetical protein